MQRRMVIARLPTTALLMGWQRPPTSRRGAASCCRGPSHPGLRPCRLKGWRPGRPRQLSVGRLGSSIQADWRARILKKPENVSGAKPRAGPIILQGSVGAQGSRQAGLIVRLPWSIEEEAPVVGSGKITDRELERQLLPVAQLDSRMIKLRLRKVQNLLVSYGASESARPGNPPAPGRCTGPDPFGWT